jgi:hypothetical protein
MSNRFLNDTFTEREDLDEALLSWCDGQNDLADDAIALRAVFAAFKNARRTAFRAGAHAVISALAERAQSGPKARRLALRGAIDFIDKEAISEKYRDYESEDPIRRLGLLAAEALKLAGPSELACQLVAELQGITKELGI